VIGYGMAYQQIAILLLVFIKISFSQLLSVLKRDGSFPAEGAAEVRI
jgi:hypothetical protein